jgi:hypothetical protein
LFGKRTGYNDKYNKTKINIINEKNIKKDDLKCHIFQSEQSNSNFFKIMLEYLVPGDDFDDVYK